MLKKRTGAKDAIAYCQKANKELISILLPKNIILMGNIALKELTPFFDKPIIAVLKTKDEKSALIRQTSINGIPTFWIHHPSMNKKFNTGENLALKKKKLEDIVEYN
ncbi:hypothetical protein [Albibacterium sp.]|uniref:hypothetical protein n=1 Tax=Albibacterium sp. TaxID=2952885 RepID=UPI002C2471AC|nr:hypothetical protein [Albibacterium sp.]HUH18043.1 hypothetical protein [Albibacterium sp.]